MVIVQVNYRCSDMPQAEWEARYTPERAQRFLAVPGLQWKIWLGGPDARRVGGINLFADRATAEAHVDRPIVARMKANPDVMELDMRAFDVRQNMSETTRAPLPSLALAAE